MVMELPQLEPSRHLAEVRYEIRGPLARRAQELEDDGFEIIKLNIGNPGAFGLRMPEQMRRAMVQNLAASEAYCHQRGIFPAREAVAMEMQLDCATDISADQVFLGAGVSELIMMAMRGMLDPGDEVLLPSPDYPLWTAAVVIHGGTAVHYHCTPEREFVPDPAEIAALTGKRTKALVLVNPNNPTGAVYPHQTLAEIIRVAEDHGIVVLSDEIYDRMLYDNTEFRPVRSLIRHTLCGTFGGLSKAWRAAGLRVGWLAFSGEREHAQAYIEALDLLASLRLCSNVTGQWAVQTALGGHQSIQGLTAPGGRLYETRAHILAKVERSRFLSVVPPRGAMYAFIKVDTDLLPGFDDQDFALELLERKHVLIAPGSSFNFPTTDHFRVTLLPLPEVIDDVFVRIEDLLEEYEAQHRRATVHGD